MLQLSFFVGLRRLRRGFSPLLNLPRQDYAALHPQFWFSIAPFPRELSIPEKNTKTRHVPTYRVSFGADGGGAPAGELARTDRLFSNVRNDACKQSVKAEICISPKNTKTRYSSLYRVSFGADDRIRTGDLRLTKALRYHLCHISISIQFQPATSAIPRRLLPTCATSATLIVYHTRSQMSIP